MITTPAAPATPAQQLSVINLCARRVAIAGRRNPAMLGALAEDIREAYLLLVGAAAFIERHHEAGLHTGGPEVGCELCEEQQAAADVEAEEDEAYAMNAAHDAMVAA